MFSKVDNGSRIALYHLMQHLRIRGYRLVDIQYLNPHTKSLGGEEMSQVRVS